MKIKLPILILLTLLNNLIFSMDSSGQHNFLSPNSQSPSQLLPQIASIANLIDNPNPTITINAIPSQISIVSSSQSLTFNSNPNNLLQNMSYSSNQESFSKSSLAQNGFNNLEMTGPLVSASNFASNTNFQDCNLVTQTLLAAPVPQESFLVSASQLSLILSSGVPDLLLL